MLAHFAHKYTRRREGKERASRKKKGEKRPYHQFGSDVKKPAMANGDCDGRERERERGGGRQEGKEGSIAPHRFLPARAKRARGRGGQERKARLNWSIESE